MMYQRVTDSIKRIMKDVFRKDILNYIDGLASAAFPAQANASFVELRVDKQAACPKDKVDVPSTRGEFIGIILLLIPLPSSKLRDTVSMLFLESTTLKRVSMTFSGWLAG